MSVILAGCSRAGCAVLNSFNSRLQHRSYGRSPHRKGSIMSKSILFSFVTVAGSFLSTGNVFACGNGASCAPTASYAAPANATPTVPADPHAGMQMSQGNRGTSYQSFSYESGAAPRVMSTPAYRTNRQSSSYNSFRGDRKALGQF